MSIALNIFQAAHYGVGKSNSKDQPEQTDSVHIEN